MIVAKVISIVLLVPILFFSSGAAPAKAAGAVPSTSDLTELSIEDLMNVQVTSVSKKAEKLLETPAAVYVITREDIRRSGATSIAELFRMVPGMDVGRINGNMWAINARGFQNQYANQMLVLMDGRSVYDPLFSGVYWDVQDTILENIDRIEVIRGPGATMWGSNAVNGVVNIITKNAKDTQSGFIESGGAALNAAQFGGKVGGNGFFRVYAKGFDWGNSASTSENPANDSWNQNRSGFRMDWDAPGGGSMTLQGDVYKGRNNQTIQTATLTPPYNQIIDNTVSVSGSNIIARLNRVISDTSSMSLQMYYDRTDRVYALAGISRSTFDLDFQNTINTGRKHEIVWGLGYRVTSDNVRNTWYATFAHPSVTSRIFNAFVQDEIKLVKDRLRLTLGSKFEHNDFTGFEIQPNVRLLYTPDARHTAWAAVSRAVRTPSRGERDLRLNSTGFVGEDGTPVIVAIMGNEDFRSEELLAHEFGYRVRPTDRLSFDATTFYNTYRSLFSVDTGSPFFESSPSPPHIVVPMVFANSKHGNTYGAEIAANMNMTDRWKLAAGYTWFHMRLSHDQSSTESSMLNPEGSSPHNQYQLRSYLDMRNGFELDAAMYYVGSLPALSIPSYTRFDLRLGWRSTGGTEVSIGVQNLFDDRHPECNSTDGTVMTETERQVYAKITRRM